MKSAPAIAFDYRPSRLLAAALVAMLALALASVALSGFGVPAQGALAAAAIGYAALALRRSLRGDVRRVAWHAAGHWRIVDGDGQEHVADLAHAVVRGAWIALRLRRVDGARVALLLAPDNSDAELRRRLRVRLARARADDPHAV